MDESEYMRIALEMNHRIMLLQAWTYKSRLAYHVGNYEMAATIYETMDYTATARPTGILLLRRHITFMAR
jgi:hypothetical protein